MKKKKKREKTKVIPEGLQQKQGQVKQSIDFKPTKIEQNITKQPDHNLVV